MASEVHRLYGRRFDSFTRAELWEFATARGLRPRRDRWKSMARWLRWELWLATRLPGDAVRSPDRDVVYLVHSGRPGHLRGWAISGYVIARFGFGGDLWPLVAHNPPETWLENLTDVRV